MDYQVDLETFRGPLDLLLFLVKRNEVDVCDIPIARVAEQFLEYIRLIELIDVEWAGEFLVMAATLLEIKSKLLLPREETASAEEADPRRELVRQLVDRRVVALHEEIGALGLLPGLPLLHLLRLREWREHEQAGGGRAGGSDAQPACQAGGGGEGRVLHGGLLRWRALVHGTKHRHALRSA